MEANLRRQIGCSMYPWELLRVSKEPTENVQEGEVTYEENKQKQTQKTLKVTGRNLLSVLKGIRPRTSSEYIFPEHITHNNSCRNGKILTFDLGKI